MNSPHLKEQLALSIIDCCNGRNGQINADNLSKLI